MKYLYPIIVGPLYVLFSLTAPLWMLLALPFIKWDKEPSAAPNKPDMLLIRGDLPSAFKWLGTINERLPGGMYEPLVLNIYRKYGKHVCAWYWLGFRNKMHYLGTHVLGRVVEGDIEWKWGYVEQNGMWRYTKKLGKLRFVCGWQAYCDVEGVWRARPTCTIKTL